MENAIVKLRAKGYRITRARTALLETLSNASTPMTVPELASCTASNEVSVYRNIDLFTKEQIVEVINTTDSLPRYSLFHAHHHHIVCTQCNFVAHIPCHDHVPMPQHILFGHIPDHEVTYYGICKKCSHS